MSYFEPEKRVSDPPTTGWGANESGRLWFNVSSGRWKYWDGSMVQTWSAGSGGGGTGSGGGGTGSYTGTNLGLPFNATDQYGWGWYDGYGNKIYFDDFSVLTPNGNPTIRTEAHTSNDHNYFRELDHGTYSCGPADRIILGMWMKQGSSTIGKADGTYNVGNAWIEYDVHGTPTDYIRTIWNQNCYNINTLDTDPADIFHCPLGNGWVWRQIDTIVPSLVQDSNGTWCTVTSFEGQTCGAISRAPQEQALVWVGDPLEYLIHPSDPAYNQPTSYFTGYSGIGS